MMSDRRRSVPARSRGAEGVAAREHLMARTFVELADTRVEGYDPIELAADALTIHDPAPPRLEVGRDGAA